ncbi:LptA, protein essential for LPS transport across the periplasm [Sulfuriferula multivorans]|uniref:Lipopolysaccharide export system protein LptA n=1 Tax=Sulfuriferula multivorans TaxID=1559896 RepID=A0A401JCL3_9PROT|nr:lipopolysaccharide transport periplasmic protein LptA [Sulfuriferula multivorans]GBL45418.1 LptA, protein essential for LPS transport across the periplasm [Sulfuriferula multivorans]
MNPSIKSPFAAVLLLLTLLLAGGPALAEKADRSKPVNIEADSVTVDDLRKVSVYLGNVVLVQGTMTLHADKIVVHQDAEGFNSATAYGNPVSFRQKRDGVDEYIEGYADRMQYDGKLGTLQLFDNAHLKRGADDLRGSYISYNSNTEFFEVKGGNNTAGSPSGRKGRVSAVIQPKPAKPGPAAPATVPLPPKPTNGIQKNP